MILYAKDFTFDGNTYVAEISELQLPQFPNSFTLVDCPAKGQSRMFKFASTDKNLDEVAGMRYEEGEGPLKGWGMVEGKKERVPVLKVLIIND